MSLEAKIEALTAAVLANTAALQNLAQPPAPVLPSAPVLVAAPAAPAPQAPPVAEATIPPTPPMPAPPAFVAAPAPAAPAAVQAPFSDAASMIKYGVGVYEVIKDNPEKVNGMNTVIQGLGCSALTEVQPHQYNALFAGFEALK